MDIIQQIHIQFRLRGCDDVLEVSNSKYSQKPAGLYHLLCKMKVSNRRKRYDVLRNTASAEMEGIMDQTTRLILAAVVGMILLLVLIIKFKATVILGRCSACDLWCV